MEGLTRPLHCKGRLFDAAPPVLVEYIEGLTPLP